MIDKVLLQVIKHREAYEEYRPIIRDHIVPPEVRTIIHDFGEFFKTHPKHDSIDWDLFPTWWRQVRHPNMKRDDLEYYNKLFEQIQQEPSKESKESLIIQLIQTDFATVVTNKGHNMLEGKMSGDNYMSDVEFGLESARQQLDKYAETPWEDSDLTDVVSDLGYESGLKMDLSCLDDSCGSLHPSNNIVVGAFVDTGKTTFVSDIFVGGMIPQIVDEANKGKWFYKRPILWFNNEGDSKKIKMANIQSFFGVKRSYIASKPEQAQEAFLKAMGGENLVYVIPCQGWHIKDADRLIKKLNPCIVIYDMLDNFKGYEDAGGTTDQRYGKLYESRREIATTYKHIAVETSQCTGEAEGVERIPMSMLYGSRVAKQGAADLIIMIGRSLEAAKQGFRTITTPKNKLESQQSESFNRNTNEEVYFLGDIKRYAGADDKHKIPKWRR